MIPVSLLLLIIVCIAILLNVAYFQLPQTTDSYETLFKHLIARTPNTSAMCFGWIEGKKAYKNVYFSADAADNKFVIRYEKLPTTHDGQHVPINDNHGQLTELENGISILGVNNNSPIECPPGFIGTTCQLQSLCSADDAGKIIPINYLYFNMLNMYNYAQSSKSLDGRALKFHQRLRAKCNNDQTFELKPCAPNELVLPFNNDKEAKCEIYDLCEEKLNGYKHNLAIAGNQQKLPKNQYYLCSQGESILQTCKSDYVFSNNFRNCVYESECYGKGSIEIPIDDVSFIQCRNDESTKINCVHGVETVNGHLKCRIDQCVESTKPFENDEIKYIRSAVRCASNKEQNFNCDTKNVGHSVVHTILGVADKYDFQYWPDAVFHERNMICVAPITDIVKDDAVVKHKWASIMNEDAPFNVKTQQFVCTDEYPFIIDYSNNRIVRNPEGKNTDNIPSPRDYFINIVTPCISSDIQSIWSQESFSRFEPFKDTLQTYSPNNGQLPLIYSVNVGIRGRTWPRYDHSTNQYTTFEYINGEYQPTTGESPIRGFTKPNDTTNNYCVFDLYPDFDQNLQDLVFLFVDRSGLVVYPLQIGK